jgi:hypothetical protein
MEKQELNNLVYAAVIGITEGREHNGSYHGNGHHLAQEISEAVSDKLIVYFPESTEEKNEAVGS